MGRTPPTGTDEDMRVTFVDVDAALFVPTTEIDDEELFRFIVIFINTPFNRGHMAKNE
jgi:hypothetical protein